MAHRRDERMNPAFHTVKRMMGNAAFPGKGADPYVLCERTGM